MEAVEVNVASLSPAPHKEAGGGHVVGGDVAEVSASSDNAPAIELLPLPPPVASTSLTSPREQEELNQHETTTPPVQPPPPPVTSYTGDTSSEWSSSRRTGRRASPGPRACLAKEICAISSSSSHSPAPEPIKVLSESDGAEIDKEEEAGHHGLSSEESSAVVVVKSESQLLPLPTVDAAASMALQSQNLSQMAAASSEEAKAQATAEGGEVVAVPPGAGETRVEPIDDPSDDRGLDTDDDSLVCVSPPSEEEPAAELSSSPSQVPVPSEVPRHEPFPSPAARASRGTHTFTTEVHESSPQDSISDEGSIAFEPSLAAASDGDEESSVQLSPVVVAQEAESDWVLCVTDAGVTYYYNPETHESQWTPPPSHTAQGIPAGAGAIDYSPYPTASVSPSPSPDALFAAAAGVEPCASQLQAILQAGANVHHVNDAGFTPLHVACQSDNAHAASLLLYYGARPDGVTNSSSSSSRAPPLFIACRHNNVELMQLLLDYGDQLVSTDNRESGDSLLHVAIAAQSPDALLYLLDLLSADASSSLSLLNGCNSNGETPMHVAVKTGYVNAVRALLRYGAAMDVEDSLGRTPLVLSIMENQVECVQLLQTTATTVNQEPDTQPTDALVGSLLNTADLDALQTYIFRLLPGSEARPELQQAVYQFCNQTRQQVSSLTSELQSLQHTHDKREAHVDQLTHGNASVTQELTKERNELVRTTELLESQQLELDTLRASHQALVSHCEMLDAIARTAQEKLKRERAEHNHYEAQLQAHLSSTVDVNTRLVTSLSELEVAWRQRLESQELQQQQSQALDEEKSHQGGNDDDYYGYTQYGDEQETPGFVMADSYEYPQYHYSADGTGTLTPVEEPGEYYYSNENDESDDIVHLDETGEYEDMRASVAAATSTPPISPSRVGAVWNTFFENVAVAAERQQVPTQQQRPSLINNNALYKPASGALKSSQVNASPASVFMAIRRSNFAELQRLLLNGMAANVRDIGEKGTPLHLACELGDLDAMKLLCEFAADVEVRDEAGNTPLLVACSQGHYECTKFLLQSAASLSAVNASGDSALHLAAWDGSADCVEIIFEYGVDPLATNNFALTPLANLKTRSPLRHKFDDLVDEHPMRCTLVLLEEMEQRALEERDEEGSEGESREPEHYLNSRLGDGHEKLSGLNPNQAGERERPSASKTSWKDWLLAGFNAKPKQEEERGNEVDEELDDTMTRDGESSADSHEQDAKVASEDDEEDDTSFFEDSQLDPLLCSLHRYEPLTPPPEIAAELLRAKLQLQRPATVTAARSYESDHEDDDEDDQLPPSTGAGAVQQQHFVAADRMRMAAKPNKKLASAAVNLRSRYVDTFNPA